MKKIYLSFVSVCLFISCTSTTETPTCTTIDLQEEYKATPTDIQLKDLASDIKEIPLETTDSSLLSSIDKIVFDNENFYIKSNEKCYIFDDNGKFISTFGHKGEDPEGYVHLLQTLYTPDGIILYDSYSRKMLYYDKEGNYQRQIKSPTGFDAIAPLNSGNFIGYVPNISGHATMHFGLFDSKGVLKDSIPYHYSYNNEIITVMYDEGCFFEGGGQLNFKEIFSDTIFAVNELKLIPRFIFELGEKGAKVTARADVRTTQENIFQNMCTVFIIGETDKYLIFQCRGTMMYNKQTDKVKKVNIKYNDEKFGTFYLSEDKKCLIGMKENEDDNQTLVVVQLK